MNSNRKTKIVEDTFDEEVYDELQDEIFDKMQDALINEAMLVKKFYDLCLEFNSFEYDESGINVEESDVILERANETRDKLLNSIEQTTSYKFNNIKTDEVDYKILFDIIVDDSINHCTIEADFDSFDLEIY